MDIRTALQRGSRLLEEAAIPAARLTAEVLLSRVLQRERAWLYGHPEELLDDAARAHYDHFLHERLQGKPTQYITGVQEFYGREFLVTPDVFIPRPETEHVVETALRLAPRAESVLDVGCGSGAIAVTLSLELGPRACVFATDASLAAIGVARANAARLGAAVAFIACDLSSTIASRSLDLLVSNPPYIPAWEEAGLPREVREFEPRAALFAGPEGLDAYRKLAADGARVLRPGGWMILELGYRQVDAVRAMLNERWGELEVVPDLAGLPRVLAARLLR
ncbi:MAG TPA: peptide chain release factor N(5)-glutamine methyltransferase [Bryobacteraceae bacterium]|nr:peptide chain release factor N(5)-glutamine methyltransferase [Bryobacteraceae bacterium]